MESRGHGAKQQMECVLQGTINSEHVHALEVLLHGLCGVPKKQLRIHEFILKSVPKHGCVSSQLYLQRDMTVESLPHDMAEIGVTWTLRCVGGSMKGSGAEQSTPLVRSVLESRLSGKALLFFDAIGYIAAHDSLKEGSAFHFRRGVPITVTVTGVGNYSRYKAKPVITDMRLVEVTAPATADNYNEVVAAVSSFCEHLAPLVNLGKPGI